MKNKINKTGISRREFLGKAAAVSAFMIVPRFVLGGKGYTAPSDIISLGFIGTGRQGINLQKSFLNTEGNKIVAACDVYQDKLTNFVTLANNAYAAKAGQENYTACQPYQDFREILDKKDIDAVVIATPDHWHAVQSVMAMKAGKDVYCEKPLSLSIKEGRDMVDAARKYNKVFQTGSMQRSMKHFRQAVELVQNGYIGEIKKIQVSVGPPPAPYNLPAETVPAGLNWEAWLGPNAYTPYHNELAPPLSATFWAKWRDYRGFGGGGMTDWGAHMFDIAQWALNMDNSGPVKITPPDGKDFQFLTYEYANGLTMTHEDFGKKNAIRFVGSEGQIDVTRGNLETTPVLLKDKIIGANEKQVYHSASHYKDWLDAIKKRSKPICDVEIGHRTATVCNIGNIAYELKRPLKWNPKKEKFKGDGEANDLRSRKMRQEWAV
jgi:predicted dehydrogenase